MYEIKIIILCLSALSRADPYYVNNVNEYYNHDPPGTNNRQQDLADRYYHDRYGGYQEQYGRQSRFDSLERPHRVPHELNRYQEQRRYQDAYGFDRQLPIGIGYYRSYVPLDSDQGGYRSSHEPTPYQDFGTPYGQRNVYNTDKYELPSYFRRQEFRRPEIFNAYKEDRFGGPQFPFDLNRNVYGNTRRLSPYDTYERIPQSFETDYKPYNAYDRSYEGAYKPYNSYDRSYEGAYKPYNTYDRSYEGAYKPYNTYDRSYEGAYKPYNTYDRSYEGVYKHFNANGNKNEEYERQIESPYYYQGYPMNQFDSRVILRGRQNDPRNSYGTLPTLIDTQIEDNFEKQKSSSERKWRTTDDVMNYYVITFDLEQPPTPSEDNKAEHGTEGSTRSKKDLGDELDITWFLNLLLTDSKNEDTPKPIKSFDSSDKNDVKVADSKSIPQKESTSDDDDYFWSIFGLPNPDKEMSDKSTQSTTSKPEINKKESTSDDDDFWSIFGLSNPNKEISDKSPQPTTSKPEASSEENIDIPWMLIWFIDDTDDQAVTKPAELPKNNLIASDQGKTAKLEANSGQNQEKSPSRLSESDSTKIVEQTPIEDVKESKESQQKDKTFSQSKESPEKKENVKSSVEDDDDGIELWNWLNTLLTFDKPASSPNDETVLESTEAPVDTKNENTSIKNEEKPEKISEETSTKSESSSSVVDKSDTDKDSEVFIPWWMSWFTDSDEETTTVTATTAPTTNVPATSPPATNAPVTTSLVTASPVTTQDTISTKSSSTENNKHDFADKISVTTTKIITATVGSDSYYKTNQETSAPLIVDNITEKSVDSSSEDTTVMKGDVAEIKESSKPWWKFWGSDEVDESTSKPWWKFW